MGGDSKTQKKTAPAFRGRSLYSRHGRVSNACGSLEFRAQSTHAWLHMGLAPPIPMAVAAPPMPVATPIPGRVGIYWPRNHGRCVIRSCVDRGGHHVDWRCRINRGCIDRRCRVRRWGRRRCLSIGRCRQISDRFCVAVVRSRVDLGRCAGC
jgi:hypothetical protein